MEYRNVSTPKPKQASATVPDEPNLSFQFTARTPDDKTVLTLKVKGGSATQRKLQIKSHNWDSGVLPVTDGLTIAVPLKDMGENKFTAHVLDEKSQNLPQHEQTLAITRLVASTGNIPAAQTIAVKALDHAYAQENVLLPLVKKVTFCPRAVKPSLKVHAP